MRLFLGIPFSKNAKTSLNQLQKKWIPFWSDYRLTQLNNFHLTLCFIGDISYEQVSLFSDSLKKLASNYHPFQLEWNGIDQFEKYNKAIVYSPIVNGASKLHRLSTSIKECLHKNGISFDSAPFKAHITLARNVRWITPQTTFPILSESDNETIYCFQLFESSRIHDVLTYTPLETYSFKMEDSYHEK